MGGDDQPVAPAALMVVFPGQPCDQAGELLGERALVLGGAEPDLGVDGERGQAAVPGGGAADLAAHLPAHPGGPAARGSPARQGPPADPPPPPVPSSGEIRPAARRRRPGQLSALEGVRAVLCAKIGRCPREELDLAGIKAVDTYAFEYIETAVAQFFQAEVGAPAH